MLVGEVVAGVIGDAPPKLLGFVVGVAPVVDVIPPAPAVLSISTQKQSPF